MQYKMKLLISVSDSKHIFSGVEISGFVSEQHDSTHWHLHKNATWTHTYIYTQFTGMFNCSVINDHTSEQPADISTSVVESLVLKPKKMRINKNNTITIAIELINVGWGRNVL